jgi:hypothetical protein
MIPPLDSPSRCDFNGGVVLFLVIFRHDGPFLAKQMVNFSSLHVEGRPADVFYHYRRDTLVNALQMVVHLILGVSSLSSDVLAWRERSFRFHIIVDETTYWSPRALSYVVLLHQCHYYCYYYGCRSKRQQQRPRSRRCCT